MTKRTLRVRYRIVKMGDRNLVHRVAEETGPVQGHIGRRGRRICPGLIVRSGFVADDTAVCLAHGEMAHAAMGVRAGGFKRRGMIDRLGGDMAGDAEILAVADLALLGRV